MAFNSFLYAFFLLSTLVLYRRINSPAIILISSSIIFYIFAGFVDTALIIFVIISNWLIIQTIPAPRVRVYASVILNIGVLFFVKYKALFLNFDNTAGSYVDITLPLGISFYCFQCLAYQIDTYKDKTLQTNSFVEFSIFISFFPQLVAGPIVRAKQLLPEIKKICAGNKKRIRLYSYGLFLCTLGLVKKIYFADSLSPIVDDSFFQLPADSFTAWKGAFLFGFQIYFDFSGYSDIALGSAYFFGIHLPVNFKTPYLSSSPQEFWQRWHITLSTWIRDYLYIPLGGGRKGMIQAFFTLIVVMSLAGLWHGANFTFIVWGLLWGIYIFVSRIIRYINFNIPFIIKWAVNITIIMTLWVFFRSPNIEYALNYLSIMYDLNNLSISQISLLLTPGHLLTITGVSLLFFIHWAEMFITNRNNLQLLKKINGPYLIGLLSGISFFLLILPNESANPFIYFRF